ncbi:DUF4160 domain-containing protein [Sterolibacteriaceae bacterium J5B]|uniref:DUF4160 domain-containing protein n=1 Tax=Sulfuricystis multivorans TaxID=2211108 RepID=UPI000F845804
MGTLLRIAGWRIMMYSLDHPPPHVHVVGPGRPGENCLKPRLSIGTRAGFEGEGEQVCVSATSQ